MRIGFLSACILVAASVLVAVAAEHAAPGAGARRPVRVVVFGAHPDDPESGAGGLIAMLTQTGNEVICAYGTSFRGGRTINGASEKEVRQREACAACKLLGASPKFFDYAHEKLAADAPTLEGVRAWLDEVKPDVVVTHWPLDTHPNHCAVASLVWQCYRRSGGWNLYFFEVETDRPSTMAQAMAVLASLDVGLTERDLVRIGFDNPLRLIGRGVAG